MYIGTSTLPSEECNPSAAAAQIWDYVVQSACTIHFPSGSSSNPSVLAVEIKTQFW